MKKHIAHSALFLTLLMPAFVAPQNARAQEGENVPLKIGGFVRGYVAVADQDDAPGQSSNHFDILRDTEIHMDGKHKLSDNFTIGAHFEFRADGGDAFDIDESYLYAEGPWGKANFGAEDGAPYLLQIAAPSADSNVDGLTQYINATNYNAATGSALTSVIRMDYSHKVSAKADKFTYITPIYSGFQAGVSWTPELNTVSNQYGVDFDNQPGDIGSVYEAAVLYKKKIGDVGVSVGGGYSHGELEAALDGRQDRKGWNMAFNLSYAGYTIGAANMRDNLGRVNGDINSRVVGVSYETGPYLFGASYMNRTDDSETPLGTRSGSDTDTERGSVGVTYKFAPGMTARVSAHYTTFEAGAIDSDSKALLLGTLINF